MLYSRNMINNLPDEPEDDVPVKVSYHTAPVSEESEKPELVEENDSLDDEEPESQQVSESAGQNISTSKDFEGLSESETEEDSDPKPERKFASFETEDNHSSRLSNTNLYYLQTVKAGEQPEWEVPKEELDVFSKPIDAGLMQYWAYHKQSGKTADDLPNAEVVANKNKSENPVIIIDQTKDHLTPGCCLELILAKDGHALAKTDSNLDNLESNITSLIDTANINFGINVEHFISTGNVSDEVDERLNDLEDAGDGKEEIIEEAMPSDPIQQSKVYNQDPGLSSDKPILSPKGERSKAVVFIPILIVIIVIGLMFFYRDKLLSKVMKLTSQQTAQVTPMPSQVPTPTPTIAIDRSKYTVRVLNGTPKTGAAGVLAEKLKSLGWNIDKTGNATSSAIAQSYVRGKVNIDEVIKLLESDVIDYQATTSAVILQPSDKADLEFVIGKK